MFLQIAHIQHFLQNINFLKTFQFAVSFINLKKNSSFYLYLEIIMYFGNKSKTMDFDIKINKEMYHFSFI